MEHSLKCSRSIGKVVTNSPNHYPLTCGGLMVETDWKPPPGFDQRLREYQCARCKKKEYRRVPESHVAVEAGC